MYISKLFPLVLLILSKTSYSADIYYVDLNIGHDNNNGTSITTPWKSLSKLNNFMFSAGDTILLKRNQYWREPLIISSSGSIDNPITYGSYGEGENPVIMRTVTFSDWKLLTNTDKNNHNIRIWTGSIPGVKNSWGMVRNGSRTPKLPQYSKISHKNIPDGYFYFPLNNDHFYYRSDKELPGSVEIGAIPQGLVVKNKHDIIISNIDIFGPGGRFNSGSSTGYRSVNISGSSSNIKLQNMTISNSNSFGIYAESSTKNVHYSNLEVHNNGSTGIYLNSNGGSIISSRSYDNGRLITDVGDRGGIGSLNGANLLIESNEVFHNGNDNDNADFEISIVGSTNVTITRNYIHDCLQGCIQFAESANQGILSYNVMSGYGTARGHKPSAGKRSAIRIGGGRGGARNIQILNNVIHGGQEDQGSREAALYVTSHDNSGLIVKNNIFSENKNKNIFINEKQTSSGVDFSNNLYSSELDKIVWRNKNIYSLKKWQESSKSDKNSIVNSPLFVNASGAYSKATDFMLKSESTAINNGTNVGEKKDYTGYVVTLDSAPDIGAFEYH